MTDGVAVVNWLTLLPCITTWARGKHRGLENRRGKHKSQSEKNMNTEEKPRERLHLLKAPGKLKRPEKIASLPISLCPKRQLLENPKAYSS